MNEDLLNKAKLVFILILTIPLYSNMGIVNSVNLEDNSQDTRSTEWILDLQANQLNNTQWYFDHLNDTDRKTIRQALDFAIPRDYIINTIMEGLAIPSLSYFSPYASPVINNGPSPRTFNLTKASDLLTEVFGYRFNQYTNDPSTPYDETKPYFKITVFIPTGYTQRIDYANEIVLNWQKIGLKVYKVDYNVNDAVKYLNRMDDYDHGGYDALFIGWNNWFHLPLLADAYKYIDPQMDGYIDTILESNWEPNVTKRDQAFLNYQHWVYDNVPNSILFRYLNLNAKNKNLTGFNKFVQMNYENWTYPGRESIVINMLSYWVLNSFNPIFNYVTQLRAYSGQDDDARLVEGPLFRGMFFTTTADNDSTFTHSKTYPYFADWYNTSVDGKTWFVNLKKGLKWHDGVDLNASDVEFTFNSILQNSTITERYNYPGQESYSILQKLTVLNSTMIKFEFNATTLIKEIILSTTILPKHILENIPMNEWASDTTNTGINGSVIGDGPYMFVNKSSDASFINLQKWDYWNDSYNTLIKYNKMGETVPGVNVPSINNLKIIVNENSTDILNGFNNGSIDICLGQFFAKHDYSFFNQISDPIEPLLSPSVTIQELDYNPFSPIWGFLPAKLYPSPSTNTTDPTNSTNSTNTSKPSSSSKSSNFDAVGIFSAFLVIATISVYSKKKKKYE